MLFTGINALLWHHCYYRMNPVMICLELFLYFLFLARNNVEHHFECWSMYIGLLIRRYVGFVPTITMPFFFFFFFFCFAWDDLHTSLSAGIYWKKMQFYANY